MLQPKWHCTVTLSHAEHVHERKVTWEHCDQSGVRHTHVKTVYVFRALSIFGANPFPALASRTMLGAVESKGAGVWSVFASIGSPRALVADLGCLLFGELILTVKSLPRKVSSRALLSIVLDMRRSFPRAQFSTSLSRTRHVQNAPLLAKRNPQQPRRTTKSYQSFPPILQTSQWPHSSRRWAAGRNSPGRLNSDVLSAYIDF